jgi:hypothetical protein
MDLAICILLPMKLKLKLTVFLFVGFVILKDPDPSSRL